MEVTAAAIVDLKSVVCCGYAADSGLLFVMDVMLKSDVAFGCGFEEE
jgi:hypothetical protein